MRESESGPTRDRPSVEVNTYSLKVVPGVPVGKAVVCPKT
jgi:hypothetical protein